MTLYNQVINNLEELKLDKTREIISDYLDDKSNSEKSVLEIIKDLTDLEIDFKQLRASKMRIKIANFPFEKTIKDYDFSYQPSVNKKSIQDLLSLRFIENKQNILFLGTPGVGKTHLATSIGIEAAKKRYGVYFINCNTLMNQLSLANRENRIEDSLRHFSKYRVLIIDEIGYLPINKTGANLFFQLIARRYENKSTIITTNQPFSKWSEVFDDAILASAILDRLLHHSTIVNITGKSYRIRDKIINQNKN